MTWMDDAACAGHDPEVFFPVSESGAGLLQIARAKDICARCPVEEACLDWALRTNQPDGVWGGMSTVERHAVRPSRRRGRSRSYTTPAPA